MPSKKKEIQPKQHQDRQPGFENEMKPLPEFDDKSYKGSGKLQGKVAIITGGDSGIGRAVSIYFAKEGANVAILYLDEHEDAQLTKQLVENEGSRCEVINGDIGQADFCESSVKQIIKSMGKVDILVNNAAIQFPQKNFLHITNEQMENTFRVNFFSYFYMTKAVLPHMKKGCSIINTSSVTAYEGNEQLIDYSATKGAITTFTRSLAKSLVSQSIRINGVAPGPIWTPLIPASFDKQQVAEFGSDNPMGRPGQPRELAPAYVYLASDDSSFVTGQMIHVNGGIPVNG
ncbi:NAD(P)-dependent oxidoreductase [Thalassobacillus devorans]|uniref:NAD(P)-dependent oxidoreductase n=1 Tax=Thalassobacillus devorans TaxID=279813 RepID=A0ABQ1NEN2_9BACI|nr:SDR family oxidoreductase [Thalassobacillus devorans]NIK27018.1 NAD(P)-dependent dehydrogenase (short-subunit alcohol dehydrogenase family) [Thalassobacillus devorans]GGC74221.1 NAD(P)-dependent oxidoreductase [Thalassobacillus devorans]